MSNVQCKILDWYTACRRRKQNREAKTHVSFNAHAESYTQREPKTTDKRHYTYLAKQIATMYEGI